MTNKQVSNVEFTTNWERINAYESESVWVAIIKYDDGTSLRLNHENRNSLMELVKEKLM